MLVKIQELRSVSEALLSRLESLGLDSVELTADYYWDVSSDAKYDPYEEPTELTLGQLTWDWEELCKLLQESGEPVCYDLVRLAAILRAIGENAPASLLSSSIAEEAPRARRG